MEENKEMLELLQKIEKSNRQQVRNSAIACILALAAAILCGLTFLTIFNIAPQVNGLVEQAQTVLANLEQTTAELAQADLEGVVSGMETLVSTGQQSLEQTMEKLNTVDFEALNDAIADLSAVVEPMAKLFGAFR